MNTIALQEIQQRIREITDQEDGYFISQGELRQWTNMSIAGLNDFIRESDQDWLLKSATVTTVSGTENYDLPEDYLEIRQVEIENSSTDSQVLLPVNLAEKNMYKSSYGYYRSTTGKYFRYLLDTQIRFFPIPTTAETIRIWYLPCATELVAGGDTYTFQNLDHLLWIVLDVSIKCKMKSEEDFQIIGMERGNIEQRIKRNMKKRQTGIPKGMINVDELQLGRYRAWR